MNPNQLNKGTRAVSAAVRLSLLATVVATGFSYTAFAAAPAATDELEEVTVTGSILRRTDTETPSPVTVLTAETLEERGINTVAEAMQRLPANNAGTITGGWNTGFNFASGATAPALRGLTVQSTLSVADGMRMAPYPLADDGQRNFVDLNTIPSAIVERIEVLRDGASSTYGADAIAGVVNVITKKEIQGLHLDGSYGISQEGDGNESRFAVTWGKGDLQADGYNFYVSAEYQKTEELRAKDRDYPFNTMNLQGRCGESTVTAGATTCMRNLDWNGVTAEDGGFNGLISIPGVSLIRPVTSATGNTGVGRYDFLNRTAGCREWNPVSITAAQSTTSPLTTCEVDFQNAFIMLQPEIERMGLSMRYTGNINDNAQFYAMGNFYKTGTSAAFTPLGFNGAPAAPNSAASYNVILPVYTCSKGVGTFNGVGTGCDATNGILNPYNPYAAAGQRAQVLLRSINRRTVDTSSEALRGAMGVIGSFGDDWRYTADFTASEVALTRDESNYMIPQKIMDVVAQGTFNFSDPAATPQAVWDYISPLSSEVSTSKLWQIQGTIAKDLMQLQGGPLQAALGASFRKESIDAPSANPENPTDPYSRYYSINAVGTSGSRDVKSAFFEVDAPVIKMVDLLASGRFDDYSTGQSNFSPKLGFKFTPFEMLAIRGTWSEGFRIPSFNEAFGLPTTGYVSRTVNCTTYAAYCASHGGNAYATGAYNVGLTQTGNPALDPEKSESFTAGLIFQPLNNLSMTLDFWRIEVKGLITGVTNTSDAEAQYYSNNGVVDIPGITAIPGTPDTAFPNALPQLGFIQSSYKNQDKEVVSGIDFGANLTLPITDGLTLRSSFEASYLEKYDLTTDAGDVFKYAGTLSPCNITSCSGAPTWRASWQNSFDFGAATVTMTAYYTSGVDNASLDFGGIKGDCQFNADNATSTSAYVDGTPVDCKSKDVWNVDLNGRYKVNDQLVIYGDILNVLGLPAPFDHTAAYNLFNYNPAWAGPNLMGRYFRIGAKYDFK
jgi:iron complex outermembrane recepter protein